LKILWFGHRDIKHPKAGGAERTIYEVSKRLVKVGYNVTLATVNPGSLRESDGIEGIKVVRVKGNIRAHLYAPLIIKKVKPDIVIDDLAHAVPWLSPYFTDKPVIAFFRHLHARSLGGQVNVVEAEVLKLIERQYSKIYGKSFFVTESETSINDLVSLGIKKERIFRIVPGINHDLFKLKKKTDEPSLIYFGGMRNYKRPWLSLELLKKMGEVQLNVAGSGPSYEKAAQKCKELDLYNRVNFTGRLSDDDLAEVLGSSWINLHFSQTEGFGLSIVEAAACGTPTVALDTPGVSEVINEFGFGLVARNLNDMKNKVEEIIKDYDIWSRKVYENSLRFSWDKTAEDWDGLLKSLA
jgi:glycosyltransferase involved in cell wall biosynthesis